MRAAGDDAHGRRLRGMIVILWRARLRIQEALAFAESDLDQRRGALLVRRGKGGRRREVGMDGLGLGGAAALARAAAPAPGGPLLCVITRGRHWSGAAHERTCTGPPPKPTSGGALRPASRNTPMPSSPAQKECR